MQISIDKVKISVKDEACTTNKLYSGLVTCLRTNPRSSVCKIKVHFRLKRTKTLRYASRVAPEGQKQHMQFDLHDFVREFTADQ